MGEDTEKYITFLVPIQKQITKIDKDSNDKIVDISYKLKFIDSFSFMSSLLSSLVDNLATDEMKNIFSYECKDCNNRLDYLRFKDNNMLFKCFQCNSLYKKQFETILLINLKIHMNFVIKTLVNLYYY